MARTITWDDLRALASVDVGAGRAISLYLDLDPSTTPTPGDAQARLRSLLDEAAKCASGEAGSLSHAERIGLRDDLDRIRGYFEREFERDGNRGLALFCAGLDSIWTTLPLVEPVGDDVTVERWLLLAPLTPLVGRGDGVLVVVAGREQGRFYRLEHGRLVEILDLTKDQPRRHDQGGLAQARLQRHVDELAAEHLRALAAQIDRIVRQAAGGLEVVVAAPEESRDELESAFTNETRAAFAGWIPARAHATPAELASLAAPVLDERRALRERALVGLWRDERGAGARAAAGWGATLEAASDARVETLLVRADAARTAWRCPTCGRASADGGACPLDGAAFEEVERGVDLAVHHVLRHGGAVWTVERADDLDGVQGIGALLRF